MCFKTYLNHPINQKNVAEKSLRAITVLKKEGGGPARYDHDHRFNVFFFSLPLNSLNCSDSGTSCGWNFILKIYFTQNKTMLHMKLSCQRSSLRKPLHLSSVCNRHSRAGGQWASGSLWHITRHENVIYFYTCTHV